MNHDFKGKVALITGAGGRRGIGRATALRLAREGADIALVDIAWPADQRVSDERDDWNGVESVAAEVQSLGRRAIALTADVTVEAQVHAAVAATVEQLGHLDILVANAAARPGGDRVAIVDLPERELRRVIDVNLVGSFLCCKAAGRTMMEARTGVVVIVSSQSGRIAKPRIAAYGASKFGQIGLTQAFAQEMAPYGVRVNAVCPGPIDNARLDWSAPSVPGASSTEERARLVERHAQGIPLGKVGTSEDVAGVIAFLCSSDASHITGQALGVDGGSRM